MQPDSFNRDIKELESLIWSYHSVANAKMASNFDFEAVLFRPAPSKEKSRGQFQPPIMQQAEEAVFGKWRMHKKSFEKVENVSHAILERIRTDLKGFSPQQLIILDKQITNLLKAVSEAHKGLEVLKSEFEATRTFPTLEERIPEFKGTIDKFVQQAQEDVLNTQTRVKELLSVVTSPETSKAKPEPPKPPPRSTQKGLQSPSQVSSPPISKLPSPLKSDAIAGPKQPPTVPSRPPPARPPPKPPIGKNLPSSKIMPKLPSRPLPVPPKGRNNISNAKVEQKFEDFDKLEQRFWELHFNDKDFHKVLEMAMTNTKDLDQAAGFIVSHFVEFMKLANSNFAITPNQINDLKKSFTDQMIWNIDLETFSVDSLDAHDPTIQLLSNGDSLVVYDTVGDGTCALHALLGTEVDGRFRCDGAKERTDLCNWLRQKRREESLPEGIKTVLEDYFLAFDLAPSKFRDAVANLHRQYFTGYSKLTKPEQDKRTQMFIDDNVVFEAYLRALEDTGAYMLQPELLAAAEFHNKTLYLYQPGWGKDAKKVAELRINPGGLAIPGDEVIHIWYNGINHYERSARIS